jgi:hypothetical protein
MVDVHGISAILPKRSVPHLLMQDTPKRILPNFGIESWKGILIRTRPDVHLIFLPGGRLYTQLLNKLGIIFF